MPPKRRRANEETAPARTNAWPVAAYDHPMPRPLPTLPHGPRRRRATPGRRLVLGCPRVSPEWELGALRVLMKPHDWTRGAIEHRSPHQHWPPGAAAAVGDSVAAVSQRLGFDAAAHFPDAGDFFFIAHFDESQIDAARALAVVASRRLPGVWFTLERLFVRDGRFFRRERGFKFKLVPATNVHLSRDTRARLRGLL